MLLLFCLQELTYLGHIISKDGINPDPEKIKVVKQYPVPTSVKEVLQFLGLCSYYRKFIRNFSGIATPLNQLHRSQRCLGHLPIPRQNTNSKKLTIKKLSKSCLRRIIKFGQAHSNNERKITLSLNLYFV